MVIERCNLVATFSRVSSSSLVEPGALLPPPAPVGLVVLRPRPTSNSARRRSDAPPIIFVSGDAFRLGGEVASLLSWVQRRVNECARWCCVFTDYTRCRRRWERSIAMGATEGRLHCYFWLAIRIYGKFWHILDEFYKEDKKTFGLLTILWLYQICRKHHLYSVFFNSV